MHCRHSPVFSAQRLTIVRKNERVIEILGTEYFQAHGLEELLIILAKVMHLESFDLKTHSSLSDVIYVK